MSNRAEREKAFFDELAVMQGDHWWGNRTKAGQLRQDIRAEMAVRYAGIGADTRILEVGCAAGDFSRRFEQSGADITAIDISPELIALARRRGQAPNVRYQVADAEALDFDSGTLNAVIGNAILHHLNLDKVLPEFKRVLKKGGKLFFTEPNMANPQVWLGLHIRPIGRRMQVSEDETAFYRWQLKRKLLDHGFVNVNVSPFDFLHPAIPDAAIPIIRRLGALMERTWIREIAGSLLVIAEK